MGLTRTMPARRPVPRWKYLCRYASGTGLARSSEYMPSCAAATARVSISVAKMDTPVSGATQLSRSVMTIESGSSPVEAAQHHTDQGFFLERANLARMLKWGWERRRG